MERLGVGLHPVAYQCRRVSQKHSEVPGKVLESSAGYRDHAWRHTPLRRITIRPELNILPPWGDQDAVFVNSRLIRTASAEMS
jgi:hypothetical protein